MNNEVKTKYNDSFLGGLSSLNMDFTSRGLSWAENIYQRLERVCVDTDIVQISCKYVDAVGEQFRKMVDEVNSDWLNTSDGCVDEPVSNLSTEQNVITEDCKISRVGLDKNASDEKLLAYVKVESVEDPGMSLDIAHDLSQQSTHGEPNKKSIPTETTGSPFADGVGEYDTNVLDLFSSPAALTSGLLSAEEVCQSETLQHELVEGGSVLSGFTSSADIHGTWSSQETVSLLGSLENECERQIEPTKLEDSVRIPEIEIDDRAGVFNNPDVFHLTAEHMEVCEDINVGDCWDDNEKYELDLIGHPTSKTISYKKKLWRALISKVRSSKDQKQAESFYPGVDMEMQNRERIDASSVRSRDLHCKNLALDSCESDWELL